MKLKGRIERHKSQSIHYLENAFSSIQVGDLEKASEFIWGSMAQALKAVAASKGIQLKSHKSIRDYAMELAKTLPDEKIKHSFLQAQSLHSNFYEMGLTAEDVNMAAEDVKGIVAKLLRLIPGQEKA